MSDTFVIETMMPDGPHWYCGIQEVKKDGQMIRGGQWSPFWEDRKVFNYIQALTTFETVCKSLEGAHILLETNARYIDSRVMQVDGYIMRAKYLSKGQVFKRNGYMSAFVVRDITSGKIKTVYKDSPGQKAAYIGVKSNEWVLILLAYDQKPESKPNEKL